MGISLRLLRVPSKKFARRLKSLCRPSERTAARAMPRFSAGVAVALSQKAGLATHPEQRPSHDLDSVRPHYAPCSRETRYSGPNAVGDRPADDMLDLARGEQRDSDAVAVETCNRHSSGTEAMLRGSMCPSVSGSPVERLIRRRRGGFASPATTPSSAPRTASVLIASSCVCVTRLVSVRVVSTAAG